MKVFLMIVSLVLVGCNTVGFREINGPDGLVYEAWCNGKKLSYGDCMNEAHRVCPRGYKILERNQDNGSFATNINITRPPQNVGDGYAAAGNSIAQAISERNRIQRRMFFVCK